MTKKVKTIKVGGGAEYAQVKDRLKEFRQDCPNGSIKTEPVVNEFGTVFKATILKDKSDDNSAEATGHALSKKDGLKEFEKLESIAIGRALAILGYSADGEIATSEEMEEFQEYQATEREKAVMIAIENLEACKTLKELKEVFVGLAELKTIDEVVEKKEELKAKLS